MNAQAFLELILSLHRSMRPSKGEKNAPHAHGMRGAELESCLRCVFSPCGQTALRKGLAQVDELRA